MTIPILKLGDYLIASVQSALTDADLTHLQGDLARQVGDLRSRGVIVDVTAADVIDSFTIRTLLDIADVDKLRGAETVIVGPTRPAARGRRHRPRPGGRPGHPEPAREENARWWMSTAWRSVPSTTS
jgi:anti-anti-sigma regulatory factor